MRTGDVRSKTDDELTEQLDTFGRCQFNEMLNFPKVGVLVGGLAFKLDGGHAKAASAL